MGVTGLWRLIESSGKPVPLDTLENKVLAIDISIWLHQVIKGFQDNKGNALAYSHLLGLFHRLCKLLYYRIKPVFVFDGGVPCLKKEIIAKRNKSRNRLLDEADRLQQLLMSALAKEEVIQKALGAGAVDILKPVQKVKQTRKSDEDDMFKLPDMPNQDVLNSSDATCSSSNFTESDSSFDEKNPRYYYQTNLQSIDVNSARFKSLPPDIRLEILTDIKETRKQSSWGRLHELPTQSDEFSSFQMKRLLKRRQVQVSFEEAEKQIEGKSLTLNELRTFLSEEGIATAYTTEATKRIASDENTRFLLVRDLKRAIEEAEKHEEEKKAEAEEGCSGENLGGEYDEDLQRAIQLSLEASGVYKDEDYEGDEVKMNQEQRKQLKTAALSLARAYMIEYGGMNDDEVKDLLESTQTQRSDSGLNSTRFDYNDSFILKGEATALSQNVNPEEDSVKKLSEAPVCAKSAPENSLMGTKEEESSITVISDDSDNDSDLVEVTETDEKKLEIVVDPFSNPKDQDDIFADVFESGDKLSQSITLSSETVASGELRISGSSSLTEETKPEECDTNSVSQEPPAQKLQESVELPEVSKQRPKIDEAALKNSKDIVAKIKEDLINVSKITLDDIEQSANKASLSDLETDQGKQKPDVTEILENLKREAKEVPKINLDDIKVGEVIEILDDEKDCNAKTPSKAGGIIENYFEPKYFVKRTPEKPATKEEAPAKVKSPFFVNKSPTSSGGKKKHVLFEDEELPAERSKKISKTLFPESAATKEDPPDPLDAAAKELKKHKTPEELELLAKDVAQEMQDLEYESNRQNRMGVSITEKMNSECMQLLRLFGIPYIVAPMEAEAQCAFLDAMQLTDGTITDDSDIWLFGGRTVYKNFFNQKKHVLEFKVDNIERLYSVDREKLIQLAILVGSDYTSGISGIGTVTALEILAAFPTTPAKDGETTQAMSVLSSLRRFRDWWKNGKKIGVGGKTALKNKLKNIEITEGFPSSAVVEAYLNPKVDSSREKFTWGHPDVESILEFTKRTFGWTRNKTDEILNPVLKRMNERKVQASIKNYFTVKSALSVREIKVSKRVKNAINKIASAGTGVIDLSEEQEVQPKKAKVRKPRVKKSEDTKETVDSNKMRKRKSEEKTEAVPQPTTSALSTVGEISPPKIVKKSPHFPDTKQVIPQRESDLLEMQKRKAKAAELFKKTQKCTSKKKK